LAGEKIAEDGLENKSTVSEEEGWKRDRSKHEGLYHSLGFSTIYVGWKGANGGGKDIEASIETRGGRLVPVRSRKV
jgi:hypothetical protein